MQEKEEKNFLPEVKLEKLIKLLDITEEDKENLRYLKSRLTFEDIYEIFVKFSKHLYGFEDFRKIVVERNVNLEELRKRRTQYLLKLLNAEFLSPEYIESRFKVGSLHSEINVTPDVFMGAAGKLVELIYEKLKEKIPKEKVEKVFISLLKGLFLDFGIILEAYEYETFSKILLALDANKDAIVILNEDFEIVYANKSFEKLIGIEKEKVKFKTPLDFMPEEYSSQYRLLCDYCKKSDSGVLKEVIYFINQRTKVYIPTEISFTRLKTDRGYFYVLDIRDLREKLKLEEEHRRISILYSFVSSFTRMLTYATSEKELMEEYVKELVEEGKLSYAGIYVNSTESKPLAEYGVKKNRFICISEKQKGEIFILLLSKEREQFFQGEVNLIAETFSELIRKYQTFKEYTTKLERDNLTGLLNRTLFVALLEDEVRNAELNNYSFAVLVFDIDFFTEVNVAFGKKAGDKVLIEVSKRLKEIKEISEKLARLEADTFATIVRIENREDVIRIIEKIKKAFEEPLKVNGTSVSITFSYGISFFPKTAKSADRLLALAVKALNEAKKLGGNSYMFAEEETGIEIREKIELVNEVKRAVENREFILYFQPQIDLKNYKIASAEALLRWEKEGKIIPPSKFIQILEETGLIKEIFFVILEKVDNLIEKWKKKKMNLRITVNISPVQLKSINHVEEIVKHFRKLKNPHYIDVEITETAMMENVNISTILLRTLRERGVKAYIDDFGTRYSSLIYLTRLPVNGLKIDVEFTKKIDKDVKTLEVVKTIISLARALNLETIAEGVETKEQERILKEIGCDYAQGYLYSPPIPENEFENLYFKFNGSS